jgi:hypothetical protein
MFAPQRSSVNLQMNEWLETEKGLRIRRAAIADSVVGRNGRDWAVAEGR